MALVQETDRTRYVALVYASKLRLSAEMKVMTTRRFVVFGLGVFAAAGTARADAPTRSLRPLARATSEQSIRVTGNAEALIAASGLSGDVVFAVADVKTGLQLEAINGDVGLPPASVAKALTTLYALDVLGSDQY